MKTLTVELGERSYPLVIGEGILSQLGELLDGTRKALVVSDENVADLWLRPVLESLEDAGISAQHFVVAAAEASKSFSSLEGLMEMLLEARPDRKTAVVALGGGVVGDLAGFAASILLRGVPFVQVPTTLLAMVDSSVGGKTGINMLQGKNLVGSFYQPKLVLMDVAVLATLPERELRAGFAEIVKYGCIQNAEFFAWLEMNGAKVLARDKTALGHALEVSCMAKAAIVGRDEREESGLRALLNFGHSFGHALEAECGYGTLLHGEAVSIGMVMAAALSARLGLCDHSAADRIKALLNAAGLPVKPPGLEVDALIDRMKQDKKVQDGKMQLILLKGIGDAIISAQATEEQLRELWQAAIAD